MDTDNEAQTKRNQFSRHQNGDQTATFQWEHSFLAPVSGFQRFGTNKPFLITRSNEGDHR